VKLYKELKYI